MTERLDYRNTAAGAMKALLGVHNYVRHSDLPTELVDLVYLRVSLINGCAYCIDMHSQELLKAGMKTEKLMLVTVWREAEAMFSEKERAAMAWAETVTLVAETAVPDEEYEAVSKHFSEQELIDLTVAIGIINAFNRLAISFRSIPASLKTAAAK